MGSAAALVLLTVVSLVYSTVGQAGGTAFLAIFAVLGMPLDELRPTALCLNVVATAYAMWRLHQLRSINWTALAYLGLPALPASFIGGAVQLDGGLYYPLTGGVLVLAAVAMVARWRDVESSPMHPLAAAALGAATGFVSGVTGVGGGVFLAPALIGLGWATARQAAALSTPFILGNSLTGLAGTVAAGQYPSPDTPIYAAAVLIGAAFGTLVGQRLMSDKATRHVLAAILLFAGAKLLLR